MERKLAKLKDVNKDNPKKGVMWYLFYCLAKSAALILSAFLFSMNNHPDDPTRNLQPFQMLIGRSVIGIFVMIVWQNIGLKKAVWDGI